MTDGSEICSSLQREETDSVEGGVVGVTSTCIIIFMSSLWLRDVYAMPLVTTSIFLQIKADGIEFSMEQFIKNANLNITEEVKTIEWKCILKIQL